LGNTSVLNFSHQGDCSNFLFHVGAVDSTALALGSVDAFWLEAFDSGRAHQSRDHGSARSGLEVKADQV
jgi:hypothetical protein